MASKEETIGEFRDSNLIFSVLEALNKQRDSSKLCDVILKISDVQIYAHSNVLASASPYFNKFFCDQELPRAFSEKCPQIIEIQIDGQNDAGYANAVNKVVDFMYTSYIKLDVDCLSHVLEIAQIMQMNNVIGFCDLFLQGCLSYSTDGKQDNDTQTDSETLLNESDTEPVKKLKRGRPRKVYDSNSNADCSIERTDLGKENNIDNNGDDNVGEKVVKLQEKQSRKSAPLVSKRGRIIKPKKFSDEMMTFIKEEPDSDSENAGNGSNNISGLVPVKVPKKYVCEWCSKVFLKKNEFTDHCQDHMNAEKKCCYCGWVFNKDTPEEEFQRHIKSHKGPYFCTFCSKKFSTKGRLLLHIPKHSTIKPFSCDICEAAFKWKHALKTHMTVHTNSKDYLCDMCGFSTAHKATLKAHRLIHTGDTFKCPHPNCDYQSIKRSNLKFHMLTHTGEKPHTCELCTQSFSLLKNLRRHMLLHSAERRLKCETCCYTTTRFDKLKEHYYKLHNIGEKPKKKFRVTEYLKMGTMNEPDSPKVDENDDDANVLDIGDGMETIELEVQEDENGVATTQILNVTSSTGESIPIAITQNGSQISYQITQEYPIEIITQ
ncbi:hypothetical protein ACF0H5_006959 [Mactra antiquata]